MEEASLMDEAPSEYPEAMTPDPSPMVGTPDVNERPESSTSNQAAENGKQEILIPPFNCRRLLSIAFIGSSIVAYNRTHCRNLMGQAPYM
jgi:hypothetical protein